MSDSALRQEACRLSHNPHVKARFDELNENAADLVGITKSRQLAEMAKIGYSNMTDVMSLRVDGDRITMSMEDFRNLSDDQRASIKKCKTKRRFVKEGDDLVTVEEVEIELHDKLKALDMINKALGYNEPDKVHHSLEVPTEPPVLVFVKPREIDPEDYLNELEEKKKQDKQ
jgi:hypothetical protein